MANKVEMNKSLDISAFFNKSQNWIKRREKSQQTPRYNSINITLYSGIVEIRSRQSKLKYTLWQ